MSNVQANSNGNGSDGNNHSHNRARNDRFRLRDIAVARGEPARMQAPGPVPAPAPAHGDGDINMNNNDNNDNHDIDINNIIDIISINIINNVINNIINNVINDNIDNNHARNDRFRLRDIAAARGGPARMQAPAPAPQLVDILNQRPVQDEIRVATGGAPHDNNGGEALLSPRPESQHGMLTRSQGQSVMVQAGAHRGETVILPRHPMTRRSQTNLPEAKDEQDDVDMTDLSSSSEGDKDESDMDYTA